MEAELIEIREFLADHPPFSLLPEEALAELPKRLAVRYLRRGTPFPPEDEAEGALYLLRSGAVELRDGQGELMEKIGEGELYAARCLDHSSEALFQGRVVEDSLFYLLPCERLRQLREEYPEFNAHFSRDLRERLGRALQTLRDASNVGAAGGLMQVEVGELLAHAPVGAPPQTTIREAARLMTRERVSALLVMEGAELVGLVTDQDLRSRCIAEGLSVDLPVERIMTPSVFTVDAETPGFEALLTMARRDVRHLPVVGESGVLGVVAAADLLRYQSANAVYLAGDVRRARTIDAVVQASRGLPELQVQLVAAGAGASSVGQALSSVADAVTGRLIELAEEQLGPPPVPYVWLAAGSQARREQLAHADQDSALLIDDGYDPAVHGEWFERLARIVCDGMQASGFVYCPGEVMACNPQWRQPWRVWREHFDRWIQRPEKRALMLACNFFDLRPLHGEAALFQRLHREVVEQARGNGIFLAHLVANAVRFKPPLGFFRNFVLTDGGEHARGVDLKRGGVMPVVDLARIYALSAGVTEIGTLDRLRRAGAAGALSEEGVEELTGAWELINTLRARHQVAQIRDGREPDNTIEPDTLSSLDRRHLKDAFGVIKGYQDALAQAYQAERFF
ncbi:putative nucleotidyltransferase substrate binding domain-containing protein [Endothiovibrio diazotrophicus]